MSQPKITVTSETEIIQVNTPTHFPTKLTHSNFPVWKTQVYSTLTGLGLLDYIDGNITIPDQLLKDLVPNPAFIIWNRQDKIILSVMLGSCHENIQPLISTATTLKDMWTRLVTLYANRSCSRVMSLKSRLMNNPCNSRSMAKYLQDIRNIADDLAIVGHPVCEDDLILLTLTSLGDEFKDIRDAIKVRESPMTFDELHEQLIDHECALKSQTPEQVVAIANYTYKPTQTYRSMGHLQNNGHSTFHNNSTFTRHP
ncbi:hypothetical protein AgCh_014083 [Apium graveolens]